jgi:hypothetical protein
MYTHISTGWRARVLWKCPCIPDFFPLDVIFCVVDITGEIAGGRLTDRISIGVLTRVVPRDLVNEVLAETRRREKRSRLLPAHVVVYFVMAMAVFRGAYSLSALLRLSPVDCPAAAGHNSVHISTGQGEHFLRMPEKPRQGNGSSILIPG